MKGRFPPKILLFAKKETRGVTSFLRLHIPQYFLVLFDVFHRIANLYVKIWYKISNITWKIL